MVGFNYIYKTSEEILGNASRISELGFSDIILILLIVGVAFACIFIVIPSIIILYEHHKSEKSKKNKRKILTQILLQKEIEDEVEKEIQIEEQNMTQNPA